MKGKFFLDTNIFVYSFDTATPVKARRATKLIREGLDSGLGIISYQVVQEFYSVAFRRFAEPMTSYRAEEYLGTVFLPMLAVHSSPALVFSALEIYHKQRLSWYDSLIVAAALEAECTVLYSEDLQSGRGIGDLKIENPLR